MIRKWQSQISSLVMKPLARVIYQIKHDYENPIIPSKKIAIQLLNKLSSKQFYQRGLVPNYDSIYNRSIIKIQNIFHKDGFTSESYISKYSQRFKNKFIRKAQTISLNQTKLC
ncbi:hypothetical protein FGO68_gene14053 [Halteria grandinella]|uniref:Uncharacterized protein n=1 Tax=Halteria grandinella TaxID=5974 RepID=A0A8J8NNS0_HALGN|nr:hypothetical protein FGO68_gene14053 [Halteria grandinella]